MPISTLRVLLLFLRYTTMLIHLLGIRKTLRRIISPRVQLESASSTIDANSLGEEKGEKAMAKHRHLATIVA
jgi:hypothetical protein